MAEQPQEITIQTSPGLVSRMFNSVVQGVKSGIVGLAAGAAAGVALDNASEIKEVLGDAKEGVSGVYDKAASLLTAEAPITNFEVAKQTELATASIPTAGPLMGLATSVAQEGGNAMAQAQAVELANQIAGSIGTGGVIATDSYTQIIAKAAQDAAIQAADTIVDAIPVPPSTADLAIAGAAAGAAVGATTGFTSNQGKREAAVDAIQGYQIQGVGQLAGMALSTAASANHNVQEVANQVKAVGEHTARLLKERSTPQLAAHHTAPQGQGDVEHAAVINAQRAAAAATHKSLA